MLNKQMGNMYGWVDGTRNFIGGRCPHNCKYCYVPSNRFKQVAKRYSGRLRLLEGEFKKPLGKNKTIFICNCNDLFAEQVPSEWITKVLDFMNKYPTNTYLLQTKNPERFLEFLYPENVIIGTTIESNREYPKIGRTPTIKQRYVALGCNFLASCNKMVSIEPILDFDLKELVDIIRHIRPKFVSIGADSKGHNLPEPSKEKVDALIQELRKFTKVNIKNNLIKFIKKRENYKTNGGKK